MASEQGSSMIKITLEEGGTGLERGAQGQSEGPRLRGGRGMTELTMAMGPFKKLFPPKSFLFQTSTKVKRIL